MNTRESFLVKRYYDNQRFPYGFSRSGDFTIQEANALETKGAYFSALQQGLFSDLTDDDHRIIKVLRGELEPQSFEEATWLKYAKSQRRSQVWLVDREKKAPGFAFNDDDYDLYTTLDIDEVDD